MSNVLLEIRRAIINKSSDTKTLRAAGKEIRQLQKEVNELRRVLQYVDRQEVASRKQSEAIFGRWR